MLSPRAGRQGRAGTERALRSPPKVGLCIPGRLGPRCPHRCALPRASDPLGLRPTERPRAWPVEAWAVWLSRAAQWPPRPGVRLGVRPLLPSPARVRPLAVLRGPRQKDRPGPQFGQCAEMPGAQETCGGQGRDLGGGPGARLPSDHPGGPWEPVMLKRMASSARPWPIDRVQLPVQLA